MDNMSLNMIPLATALKEGINLKDGKRVGNISDEFQKLLDQKAQSARADSKTGEQSKSTDAAPDAERPDAPVQKEEDPQATAKRLSEAGLVAVDPGSLSAFVPEEQAVTPEGSRRLLSQVKLVVEKPFEQVRPPVYEIGPVKPRLLVAQAPAQPGEEAAVLMEQQPQQQGDVSLEAPVENAWQPLEAAEQAAAPETGEDEPEIEITDAEQAPRQVFADTDRVLVKVGENHEPEQTRQPNVADQIDAQLSQAMQKGESHVRVQLTPESLGTVTVEISKSADGILRVALSAHSSETRGLLERHAANLQTMLSSRTEDSVRVEVQRQQESQQSQDQHPYDGHNGHNRGGEQQQRQHRDHHSQDFMQQLRLGLFPDEEER